jgi:hypothetical protein
MKQIEGGALTAAVSELKVTELEREIKTLKNQLLMSMSREEGLNESLDLYEKELHRGNVFFLGFSILIIR